MSRHKRGDIIGVNYEVIKKIGAGSFGTIYLAENTTTKKQVAIKVEPSDTKYPMIIYEANITIIL